ncbi:Uncharacterised protein [Bordetella pertussis]|nr:Uncharacterised protein [Bordetella pertussis]CPJ19409.1 Uncharacterised protein [Bordetella pertussis]CPM85576.1 Uncharacterised protein [Bordetella pertussis]CPN72421.1 Uncharacterised protein [Bordetella pertussis]
MVGRRRGALARLAAHDRDEAGAESLHARIVLVAAGLVDGALTAVRGLQRHYRQAIRLHAAIAAVLADGAVDQQAARRIRELVLLAAPALLGRAGLVVDQHGDAGRGAQLALHRVQVAAVVHLDAGAQGDAAVFFRLVGGDDDARHVLAAQLLADLRHRYRPVDRLAAGHGHGVVEQDLVGDVGARGHGLADRQVARVVIRAFAHVLEHVRHLYIGRQADPVGAFAAHLGQAAGVAVHPGRHVMAAHAGQRLAAFGHLGGGAVRTARTEVGAPAHAVGVIGKRRRTRERFGRGAARHMARAAQPRGQRGGQQRRPQLPGGRNQLGAIQPGLAGHAGALRQVEQQVLDLAFDDRAFFLDDQDVPQALREFDQARSVQRPGQAGLVDAHRRLGADGVQAQPMQGLHGVQVRLAHRDDAERGARGRADQPVQRMAARERAHRAQPAVHAQFDRRRQKVARGVFQLFGGQFRVVGHLVGGRRLEHERLAAFHGFRHRLERDPCAAVARQRPAP